MQIVFWMAFTHLKSRFMLPCAIPSTAAIALCLSSDATMLRSRRATAWVQVAITALLLLSLSLPIVLFSTERSGAPAFAIDFANQFTGDGLPEDLRRGLAQTGSPIVAINHSLPSDSKTLLVGQSAPLYFDLERIAYATTWDRGPFSRVIRAFPRNHKEWCDQLRQAEFTHVLVDEGMLRRWERAGWNDPMLTADEVRSFLSRHATELHAYPNSVTLYRLN
jgi:hypothetical protein